MSRTVSVVSCVASLGLFINACGPEPTSNDDPVVIIDTGNEEGCSTNADCTSSSDGPICDTASKACKAGCLVDGDCTDAEKTSCDTGTNTCVAPQVEETGCTTDADCTDDPAGTVCNVDTKLCEPFVCEQHTDCEGDTPVCLSDTGQCVAGCLGDEGCTEEGLSMCDLESNTCVAPPVAPLLGTGDGSVESVNFVNIYTPPSPLESTDLAFHPERNELWVLHREFEVQGQCTEANPRSARCNSLWGSTTIIKSPGLPFQSEETRVDANAWHFMRRPPALAMGAHDTFATCGEAATGNFEDNDVNFIGPTLWSSDLDVYARPSGGNGSHLDMLHATPWCMGIAHERDNVYWVFNGDAGSIDRYDFHEDHGPGNDYHADGEIFRYVPGEVERVPGVPSHMVFNPDDAHLYVVDTGHARIIKLDTTQGMLGAPFSPVYEPLASYGFMNGASMVEVVTSDMLVQPSGLALHDGTLYVSDHATGKLHAFDLDGNLLRSLQTPFGEGSLAGIEVGPNNNLWFTDMKSGSVHLILPEPQ